MRTNRHSTRDSAAKWRRGFGLLLSAVALATVPAASAQAASAAAVARPKVPDAGDRAAAQAAAEQGLADYVARKQQHGGATAAFDLAKPQDIASTRIAGGFEVHTIAPKDLIAGRGELRQMALPTGIWRFFVKVAGRPVGLVTVQRMDGRWQAVSFGGAGLAQELSDLMAEHADVGADRLRFIRVHQAQADLLEVTSPADLQARYAMLASARTALGSEAQAARGSTDAQRLLDTYELMEPLRNAVRRGLDARP